ncbi:hypothetical protein CKO09_03455 [Chromatium weissei]|nr:hypothetical protein [Chromatium weissei]
MKIQRTMQILLLASTLLTFNTQAADTVQFSADMVSSGPNAAATTGKMFIGDGRVRIEMKQDGRELVRIHDQQRRVEWILFPAEKRYLENAAPTGDNRAPPSPPSAEDNPCAGLQDVTCQRIGVEQVGGRDAIKWEMTVTRDGKTLTGAQWLDVQRGLPVKYVMPNGQSMELTLLETETRNGRDVEKWEMVVRIPDQAPLRTLQWYDPQLKLAVREEFPDGNVRALEHLQLGAQPDDLFRVPADYTRMEPAPSAAQ